MVEAPSGTVTFLFTDIEGSSRLWEAFPDAMTEALDTHDGLLREVIEAHHGYVVKSTGDGLFAAFATAHSAVVAAIACQLALIQTSWEEIGLLQVRIGLHTGEAVYRYGDYHGQVVNRTARLMSAGHGGQVLVSATTAAVVGERLPDGIELVALGEHRLRDLARPEVVYQLVHPGLAREFPALRSLDSYPGNLPLQASSFIGRQREQDKVAAALGEARVVTLTGVGGVGKTRLALQVAAGMLPRFREGAWLAELAPVRDPAGVPGAVAAVFGVTAHAGMTVTESLVDFLRTKQLLLVLDNCEHLLDAAVELIESLQRGCAGLAVLATSREGLGLDGERILVVPSLALPIAQTDLETVATAEAVRLFVERAQAVNTDFLLSRTNAAAVVRVCRRLDGVPLAIELAAARVPAMNPAELARGLDRRFEVLAGGRRRAVERHQTLRAVIDWSYELLAEADQRLLARLSVFAGGCTLEAIEAVCVGEPVHSGAVFALVAGLVAKSLVVATDEGLATRYRLTETIRQYGEERLDQHGETEARRGTHAEYYNGLAFAVQEDLEGPDQMEAGRRLEAERENLLAATNYAIDTDNADLALRLVRWVPDPVIQMNYEVRLPVDAVLRLNGVSDHPLYPYALAVSAGFAAQRGEVGGVEATCEEAVAAAKRLGSDPEHRADEMVAIARSAAALAVGRWAEAASHLERAAEICRPTNRIATFCSLLTGAAGDYAVAGEPDRAVPLASEALEIARRLGTPVQIARSLASLAGALVDVDPPRARALLHESIKLRSALDLEGPIFSTSAVVFAARTGDWTLALQLMERAIRYLHWGGERPWLSGVFNLLARAIAQSDATSAAVLQGAARRLAPTVTPPPRSAADSTGSGVQVGSAGPTSASFVTSQRRETTELLRQSLGEARRAELRAEGEAMDEDQAVAHALHAIAKALKESSGQTGRV
jgi:predicted ATPase/class 3 adenylate cyclase